MTKALNREEWFVAWKKEAEHLHRAYQCVADPDLFESLSESIKDVVKVIFEISNRMESEGVWKK